MPRLGKGDAVIDERFALDVLPHRHVGAHKWGVGGVVIVAGAPGYVGAPALSAMAAGRVGAGIVLLAVPRPIIPAIAANVPEAVYLPLADGDAEASARRARELIVERGEKARAFVVGPGLGTDEHATALLAELFRVGGTKRSAAVGFAVPAASAEANEGRERLLGAAMPAVVDADALNWLAEQPNWWEGLAERSLVLTPHVGEMSRLLDCATDEVIADPIAAARAAAVRWKQVVVLKYGFSVATDGTRALVAPDAPVSLATAGSGDVLSGAIGGLLAQGLSPLDAAGLALFVGCRAARRAEQTVGVLGLVASDLPLAMAEELRDLDAKRGGEHA
jgi:NAD(P)H-hydrate epimerase